MSMQAERRALYGDKLSAQTNNSNIFEDDIKLITKEIGYQKVYDRRRYLHDLPEQVEVATTSFHTMTLLNGKRFYLHDRTPKLPDNHRISSIKLLSRSIPELQREVDRLHAHQLRKQQSRLEEKATIVDIKRKHGHELWVDKYAPKSFLQVSIIYLIDEVQVLTERVCA
jgi:hypothetical protein